MLFLNKKAMNEKLLAFLFICLGFNSFGQTTETITIDWSFNSTPSASGNANTNRTIEVGDTVTWNWYASGSHNVNSLPSATESFQSSFLTTGGTFSHTFTSIGDNPYQCDPHAGIMFGTISVFSDGTLSVETEFLNAVSLYPNPVSNILNFNIPRKIDNGLDVKIFDVFGKLIKSEKTNELKTSISVSELKSGIYLIQLSSNSERIVVTKRFVKL